MVDFTLHYRETEPAVKLKYVEAKIKPETVGHVTPTYEDQTVYPAAGTTFGRVDVDAIPDPTAVKEIDSNGDHDVRRYGVARVNVQPTLQEKQVTPTKQTQTVTADTGYDGLESVEVEPIPSEYVVPSGTLNITENADGIDVTDKAAVNVNVPIPPEYIIPAGTKTITENGTGINVREFESVDVDVSDKPTKGVVLGDFNDNGCPTSITTYGFTALPSWYFYDAGYNRYNRILLLGFIAHIYLNEGLERIEGDSTFREMSKVTELRMPSTLTSITGVNLFLNTPLALLDMSLLESVPNLGSQGIIPSTCTIRVKQSLLSEFQSATNWSALTNWEGV